MFDSITQIFNTTVNNHAQQAKFNERLREVQQLGLNKRLKSSNNPRDFFNHPTKRAYAMNDTVPTHKDVGVSCNVTKGNEK